MSHEKPSIPDVIDRFLSYKRESPSWGSLHTVLDDGNFENDFVDEESEAEVRERGDEEGAQLTAILRLMSKTQRKKMRNLISLREKNEFCKKVGEWDNEK